MPSHERDADLMLPGKAAVDMIRRLRPEFSLAEADGRLKALVDAGRVRFTKPAPWSPPVAGPGDTIFLGLPHDGEPWHARHRFSEADLARHFAPPRATDARASREGPLNGPPTDEPSSAWLTFPLARARVVMALRCPEDAAAEWLRLRVTERRVCAAFTRLVQSLHPNNLKLVQQRTNNPEREDVEYCHWIMPSEVFKEGPQVMAEYQVINHTRWYAADIDAALAGEATVLVGPTRAARDSGAGETGRKAASAWASAAGRVAGWLAAAGGAKTQQAELERRLLEAAETYGKAMSEPTARRLASAMLEAFREETG